MKHTIRLVSIVVLLASGMRECLANTYNCNIAGGANIQTTINSVPSQGGTIVVYATSAITVKKPIVIAKNNITIDFRGSILKLANNVNCPILVVGQTNGTPSIAYTNINIENVVIDGNKSQQTNENWNLGPALRNDGICLRLVNHCSVRNAVIHDCRSGGLVSERGCTNLIIRGIESYSNQFDGIAGYVTTDSIFADIQAHDNPNAGLSFDGHFDNNLISDCVCRNNGQLGIFIENSNFDVFSSIQIIGSGQDGIFVAQDSLPDGTLVANTPVTCTTFTGCVIKDSNEYGIVIANDSCVNNLVTSCQLINNPYGGIFVPPGTTNCVFVSNTVVQ